jgi:calcineurin-like phosphoesterase family protein
MALHRGFGEEFYHDEKIIDSWNRVVNKKDTTYILGDVTMETKDHYHQLDRLNGRKIVVLGNHDRYQDVPELLKYVDGVTGMVDYKGCVLTHAPIHPSEVGFCRANIHAHIHENVLAEAHVSYPYNDPGSIIMPSQYKYVNVDAMMINYTPITLDEALAIRDLKEALYKAQMERDAEHQEIYVKQDQGSLHSGASGSSK